MPYRKPPVSPTHPQTKVPSHHGGDRGGIPFHSSSTSGCDQLQRFVENDQKAGADSFTDQDSDDAVIVEYNDKDVLSGRGKSNLKHPGNQKYQGEQEESFLACILLILLALRGAGGQSFSSNFPSLPLYFRSHQR
jgi:hypothetical protein